MGKSALIALVAIVALVLWMLSGQLGSNQTDNVEDKTTASMEQKEKDIPKMKVQTQVLQANSIAREVVVQGQLEPAKVLRLRAETSGNIQQLLLDKGDRIGRGQILAKLSEGNRVADVAVAKASQVQADNEYQAARKLSRQGLQSKFSLETASAKREAARAQVQAAELELSNIEITAPIDALIEDIIVEEGDFIERGAQIATLVDNSRLLVTGAVPQQHIAVVKKGQTAVAQLVTGETLRGKVHYISSMAEDTTRSFKVEVLIDQAPANIVTGISAQINIPVETLMAHKVSPAVLALDDNGALGIKAIGEDNIVVFHEIEVVKTESNGAWVTGLPDQVTLITLGQGFVNPGEEVDPVSDTPADSAEKSTDDNNASGASS